MTSGDGKEAADLATLGAEGQDDLNDYAYGPGLPTMEDPQWFEPGTFVPPVKDPGQLTGPLPNEVMRSGDPTVYKQYMCRSFAIGQCNEGPICPFSHGKPHEEGAFLWKTAQRYPFLDPNPSWNPAMTAAASGVFSSPSFGMYYMEPVPKWGPGSAVRPLYVRQPYLYENAFNWMNPAPYLTYIPPYNYQGAYLATPAPVNSTVNTVMYNGMLWNKQALQGITMEASWWPSTQAGIWTGASSPNMETNYYDGRKRRVPQKHYRKRRDYPDSYRMKTTPEDLARSRWSVPAYEQGASSNRRAYGRNRNPVIANTPPRYRQRNLAPKKVVVAKAPEPPVFIRGGDDQWPTLGADKDSSNIKCVWMKPPAKPKDQVEESPKANKDDGSKSASVDKEDEAKSPKADNDDEAKSPKADNDDEAKSPKADKDDEAKSASVDKEDEAKSAIADKEDEAKSASADKDDEAKSASADKDDEAKSASADKDDEAKSPGADKEDEAKSASAKPSDQGPKKLSYRDIMLKNKGHN